MPLYKFKCPECGLEHELECSIKEYEEKKLKFCKNCGYPLEREFDSLNFILKGDGFPGKDYKDK